MSLKFTPLVAALLLGACARDAVTAPPAPSVSTGASAAAATLSVRKLPRQAHSLE